MTHVVRDRFYGRMGCEGRAVSDLAPGWRKSEFPVACMRHIEEPLDIEGRGRERERGVDEFGERERRRLGSALVSLIFF